jgi:ankyrin repeat protein
MKETYSNKDILIPDFNTEKNMINNKEFETISSSNKYIIQIQTDNSKPEEISNLGNDIMKILKYYIKNDNEILAIKIIKDYIDVINLNYKNKEGMTLLLLAIKNNCSDKLIQFLLDKGADPNVFDVRILYNLNYNIIYYFSSKEILHYIMLFLIIILKLLIC